MMTTTKPSALRGDAPSMRGSGLQPLVIYVEEWMVEGYDMGDGIDHELSALCCDGPTSDASHPAVEVQLPTCAAVALTVRDDEISVD